MAFLSYKEGSTGSIVRQIQRTAGAAADGKWGPVTTECVRKWQQAHGLKADGIAGPATLARMGIAAAFASQTVSDGQGIWMTPLCGATMLLQQSRRDIRQLVIHCTATPEGRDCTVTQIRNEHLRRGWADIGYHYVIYRDGSVHEGRSVHVAGAHVTGHNANSIGIAYVGGLTSDGREARDTRTQAQRYALRSLLADLRRLYPKAAICGHRDFSPDLNGNGTIEPQEYIKQCPCFDAIPEYRDI